MSAPCIRNDSSALIVQVLWTLILGAIFWHPAIWDCPRPVLNLRRKKEASQPQTLVGSEHQKIVNSLHLFCIVTGDALLGNQLLCVFSVTVYRDCLYVELGLALFYLVSSTLRDSHIGDFPQACFLLYHHMIVSSMNTCIWPYVNFSQDVKYLLSMVW